MKRRAYTPLFLLILVGGGLLIGFLIYNMMPQSFPPIRITPTPSPMGTGEIITFSGEMMCLPHKDTSGPQTMECAYGLKTPEGMYYALRDTDPTYKHISGIAMGKHVTVQGRFTPKEDKLYPTEGTIEIQSIEEN